MPLGIIGQLLFQLRDELRALGARADEAHLALQHRPGLRQFVDPHLADDAADAGDAGIVLLRPDRVTRHLGILTHRAQLQNVEALVVQADAALAVEGGALRFEADRHRGQQDDRQREGEQHQTGDDVEGALEGARHHAARGETVREDQPRRVDRAEVDPPRLALEEAGDIGNGDARGADAQQVLQRQRVAAFLQRQHHLGDLMVEDMRGEIGDGAARDRVGHHRLAIAHRDEAGDDDVGAGLLRQITDSIRLRARPQHENAPLEQVSADETPDDAAYDHEQHRRDQRRTGSTGTTRRSAAPPPAVPPRSGATGARRRHTPRPRSARPARQRRRTAIAAGAS
ncbi:hypothetical protein WR25_03668 [Diploscapter pachys]|uniref:Uncharacterized protein n=1 Tax=Diploscapter pachys TaxID=2018661 RepID=A0A2A2M3Q0_9BILA|nr:hypothetical protein WR25_03668 [Diploscapter pachys]